MTTKLAVGYVDSSQQLLRGRNREWDQAQLLEVAKSATLPHTGWPIGVVLEPADVRPVPMADGIEARIDRDDYWAFTKDGRYYTFRQFEENSAPPHFVSSLGHPARPIFFDIRILQIAELILHSAALYRALGVSPDEPYHLSISHGGIEGREFYKSTARRRVRRGRICKVPEAKWTREVTQDYAVTQLKALVDEVANGLFVLFDFATVESSVVGDLVDGFLNSGRARGWFLPRPVS